MIISERQIMHLIEYCRELANASSMIVIPRKALELINQIKNQQSEELKVVK